MHEHAERPAGPDFLANFAEQNLNSGLEVNAQEFRVRADEWRKDQAKLAELEATNSDLQDRLDSAQRVLNGARRA